MISVRNVEVTMASIIRMYIHMRGVNWEVGVKVDSCWYGVLYYLFSYISIIRTDSISTALQPDLVSYS